MPATPPAAPSSTSPNDNGRPWRWRCTMAPASPANAPTITFTSFFFTVSLVCISAELRMVRAKKVILRSQARAVEFDAEEGAGAGVSILPRLRKRRTRRRRAPPIPPLGGSRHPHHSPDAGGGAACAARHTISLHTHPLL